MVVCVTMRKRSAYIPINKVTVSFSSCCVGALCYIQANRHKILRTPLSVGSCKGEEPVI
jgi:hypothetical protein